MISAELTVRGHLTTYGHRILGRCFSGRAERKTAEGDFDPHSAAGPSSGTTASNSGLSLDRLVHKTLPSRRGRQMAMKTAQTEMDRIQGILERKHAELVQVLRKRDSIAIEKSADPVDEIQCASERDVAIRNVDRESNLLRQVRAALQRIRDGSYGTCIECESAISSKRLAAVPWAPRCIQCQEAADGNRPERTETVSATLLFAA